MGKCEKCQKETTQGLYSVISDLCDDCYIKAEFYTPDIQYPESKRKMIKSFRLNVLNDATPLSAMDLLMKFMGYENEMHNQIMAECKQKNKCLAVVFAEYDKIEKIKEICKKGIVDLEVSYYFTDELLMTVPNYEDRNKYRNVLNIYDYN